MTSDNESLLLAELLEIAAYGVLMQSYPEYCRLMALRDRVAGIQHDHARGHVA